MGDIVLPIDTAVHCGLIITEIVTNSIKYAFPEGGPCHKDPKTGCTISITMSEKDGFIILNASDNGRGIPPGTIQSGPGSLGLTLIRILAKNQLHGDMEMHTTRGTSFEIRFVKEPDWIKGD
jgi:two-component sensor histidine kinase